VGDVVQFTLGVKAETQQQQPMHIQVRTCHVLQHCGHASILLCARDQLCAKRATVDASRKTVTTLPDDGSLTVEGGYTADGTQGRLAVPL